MSDALARRIRSRLKKTGKTARGASLEAKLSASFVRNIFEKKSESPRSDSLHRLAVVLRTTSAWLLRGEGPEEADGSITELEYVPIEEEDARGAQVGERYRPTLPGGSPEVDSRAGAGRGQRGSETQVAGWSGERIVDEWVFPSSFHHEMRTQAGMVWIMPVIGNSMEPELLSGDRVLVDTTHIQPSPDAIYVIDEGAGPEVKQVQRVRGSKPPKIRIISANPTYPPVDRPADEIRIIGRVCGRVSRM